MKAGELFAGYGGLALAVEQAFGAETAWVCEYDEAPAKILAHRFPHAPNHRDVTAVNWGELEPVQIISGGSPCFKAGTLIETEHGLTPIERITLGTKVRTHTGAYKPVIQLMNRETTGDAINLKIMGSPSITTTLEHPFFVRTRTGDGSLGEPYWKHAGDLTPQDYVGFQFDTTTTGKPPLSLEEGYIIGRWLGEGSLKDKPHKTKAPQTLIGAGKNYEKFVEVLHQCEDGLPNWVFQTPLDFQASILQGWVDAAPKHSHISGLSTSEKLIHSMARIARNVHRTAVSVHRLKGETDQQAQVFKLHIPAKNISAITDGDWVWTPVLSTSPAEDTLVYNIGVQDDESYRVNGIAVHNCQDISAAGARRGMTEGTRSNLWVAM